jgi:hypothetical protein
VNFVKVLTAQAARQSPGVGPSTTLQGLPVPAGPGARLIYLAGMCMWAWCCMRAPTTAVCAGAASPMVDGRPGRTQARFSSRPGSGQEWQREGGHSHIKAVHLL